MNWKKLNINALEDDTQYLFHHKYEIDHIMKYDVMTFFKHSNGYELHGEFNYYKQFELNKKDCPYDYYIEIPEERLKNNRILISPEKRLPQDEEIVVGIVEASIYYGNKKNIQVFQYFKDMVTTPWNNATVKGTSGYFKNETITYFPEQLRWWFRFPQINSKYVIKKCLKDILKNGNL